ncbi:hypothetical protein BDV26DRAFT_272268 [Aspergillus bertholletiae]|uniref:Secreted protein n=1 Tax=Aspergillus bertholletiae TaxID=1226010 RepID=A0A5N7AU12_9EURO|nr:hypothetical protein BDV26DRAFT_272268 [Aspergillus bertholletiae]
MLAGPFFFFIFSFSIAEKCVECSLTLRRKDWRRGGGGDDDPFALLAASIVWAWQVHVCSTREWGKGGARGLRSMVLRFEESSTSGPVLLRKVNGEESGIS